eukprot:TRINITY_DN74254_c0_g1_i1.p1 TRINITY_DN74254_c0_g1~~TRINITY_DN74254_c0_g1_i1.p1  ORF type:complete len:279 (-),score=33.15 TRINITY_DN74254_c0_g1_i1:371-1207(-)
MVLRLCAVIFAVLALILSLWAGWCQSLLPPVEVEPGVGKPFKAVVLGGSGACGGAVVRRLILADDVTQVTVLTRRPITEFDAFPKVKQHLDDMSDLERLRQLGTTDIMVGHDVAFMLLGVGTARNVSRAALQRVDVDIPTSFAHAARVAGVAHMSVMTAVGANSSARDSGEITHGGSGTYNQIKGMLEDAMVRAAFPGSLRIFRPAMILGTPHSPAWLAGLAPWLQRLMPGQYRFSSVDDIARGMVAEARRVVGGTPGTGGTRILHVPEYTAAAGIPV